MPMGPDLTSAEPSTVAGMGEPSLKDKIDIAAKLLSQCPPGEFADVLQDEESLMKLHETIMKKNMETGTFVKIAHEDEDLFVPLSRFNITEDGRFIDPDSGILFRVNHYNLEVEDLAHDETVECRDTLRLCLKQELEAHLKKVLPKGHGKVFLTNDNEYGLVTVGEKFQLANMRNGQWYSEWSLADGKLVGKLQVIVHYFEDGNVQLASQKQHQVQFDLAPYGDDYETAAHDVLDKIREMENKVQLSVNECYSQLSDTTFKRLRRQLPITRSKVDWGKLASYKVGDQLQHHH